MNKPTDSLEANGETVVEPEAENRPVEGPRSWARRHWIIFAVSMVAGFVAWFWEPLEERLASLLNFASARRHDNPYFQTKKIYPRYSQVSLSEGFYRRKSLAPWAQALRLRSRKDKVIQYVDAEHRVPFVSYISQGNLERATMEQLALTGHDSSKIGSLVQIEHVSRARASALFEMAALQQVKIGNHGVACEYLVNGMRHDLAFKRGVRGAPSLRLLDLLAKVSVRHDQSIHFATLLQLSEEAKKFIGDSQYIRRPARRKGQGDKSRPKRVPLSQDELKAARQKKQNILQKRIDRWNSKAWHAEMKKPEKLEWAITVPAEAGPTEGSQPAPRTRKIIYEL